MSNSAEPVTDPAVVAELMFSWMQRARRVVDGRLAEEGLSMTRAKMLGRLKEGACPQSQLAGAFDLAPRTITELVDGLEKAGLVERVIDPHDRRVRQVHLTAAGLAAHERTYGLKKQIIGDLFGTLDESDLHQLVVVFRQLHKEFDSRRAESLHQQPDST